MSNRSRSNRAPLYLRLMVVAAAALACALLPGCAATTAGSSQTNTTPTQPAPLAVGVTVNGMQLQVVTSTLQATFTQAALTALVNRTTGESYIATAGSNWLNLPLLQTNGQTLTGGSWAMNADGKSASIQFTDSQRTLIMTAGLADDDLFLRFSGASTVAGVVGLTWGIQGLNLSPGRLVIPGQDGTYFDAASAPSVQGLDYPVEWENQMVVYQGSKGNLLMYARDPTPTYKRLLALKPNGTLNVSFEMFAPGPWPSSTAVAPVEWRLHGFAGSWTAAADVYKSYMTSIRPFTAATGSRAWVKSVRGVVIFETLDATLLDALAQKVVPARTVLLMTTWRQQPFDMDYPDYTPDPAAAQFISRAHQLGFRVMLHVNLLGVSEANPFYSSYKQCQIKTSDTLQPTGWLWDTLPSGDPRRFAYISPACSAYRKLFISQIKPAIDALQPDALHLDAGGAIINDGNGIIEGMNTMQGMMQLHQDLLAAFPNLVLGGENTNEILAPYNWLAQRWPANSPSHPIGTYLMGDQVFFYGFLDQPGPEDNGFANYLARYEGLGVVPVAFIVTPHDLDATNQRTQTVLAYQKSVQTKLYSPDWVGDWTGQIFRQKSADNSSVLSAYDDGTFLKMQENGSTLYARAHGANMYTTSSFIANWPAYDDSHLYGADQTQQYWLTNTSSRPTGETHLLGVPANMQAGPDTIRTSQYSIFEIDALNRNWFDFVQEFAGSSKGTIYNQQDYGVINGAVIGTGSTFVKGTFYGSVLFEHPPYLQALGGSDYIEYSVPVPVAPKVSLTFQAGISDGNSKSDGVLFGVQVNGNTLWKTLVLPDAGWTNGTVDLTAYAGTTVKLRLLTHPGLALNPYFDSACWNALQINTNFAGTATLKLQLPSLAASAAQVTPNAALVMTGAQTADVTLPLPGKFAVFPTAPASLASGQSLLTTPMTVWQSTGSFPAQAVYENSGTIGAVSSAGVTKNAIAAIPRRNGRTTLTSAVTLPSSATTLSLGYALADPPAGLGTITNYSGVNFIVLANGTQIFNQAVSTTGWANAQIDISAWRGQPVLFELVVDADGDQLFDFAYFSDLTIH